LYHRWVSLRQSHPKEPCYKQHLGWHPLRSHSTMVSPSATCFLFFSRVPPRFPTCVLFFIWLLVMTACVRACVYVCVGVCVCACACVCMYMCMCLCDVCVFIYIMLVVYSPRFEPKHKWCCRTDEFERIGKYRFISQQRQPNYHHQQQ
jgi:hypothetical protein